MQKVLLKVLSRSWGFKSALKDFDKEVYDKLTSFVFEDVESSYKVFRNDKTFDGIEEFSRFYKMLKKAGGQISICTTQKEPWHRIATLQWLENSSIVYDNVILAGDKKGHFGLDYHIDDKWENIAAVEKTGGTGYLLKRKWNSKSRNRVKNKIDSLERYVKAVLNKEVNSD